MCVCVVCVEINLKFNTIIRLLVFKIATVRISCYVVTKAHYSNSVHCEKIY